MRLIAAPLSLYAPENRRMALIAAGVITLLVAVVDWWTKPYISLGFLYLFPIMLVGGFLSRSQIIGFSIVCAVLQEKFSNLPPGDAIPRLILSSAGFIGTGLFFYELIRNRCIVVRHLQETEAQIQLRREAEEQLRVLVESSPAAIVTVDSDGIILLANHAAQQLLAPGSPMLAGQNIQRYLPALLTAVQSKRSHGFRTTLQCRGQRIDGEMFLAGVWFSTYSTQSGGRLAAIVVDLSEDLRNREDLSLDYLLRNTRILMSAISHEIRNLCGAALVVHKNLTRVTALQGNADFDALGTLIQGLEKLSSMELRGSSDQRFSALELTAVLDELRVLIESTYQKSDIDIQWAVPDSLPLVWADRYGLMQVFLNLAKNSLRAMQQTRKKQLAIRTSIEGESVVVRFEDTGVGVADPRNLFRPFQEGAEGSGLGLYVSRALVKGFGGDLTYRPRENGAEFAVWLRVVNPAQGADNA